MSASASGFPVHFVVFQVVIDRGPDGRVEDIPAEQVKDLKAPEFVFYRVLHLRKVELDAAGPHNPAAVFGIWPQGVEFLQKLAPWVVLKSIHVSLTLLSSAARSRPLQQVLYNLSSIGLDYISGPRRFFDDRAAQLGAAT